MKGFYIFPQNKNHPESSIKITQNENGIERYEYDLAMEVKDISIKLKVKLYSTKSSLDVQGLKHHFSQELEILGNRTVAVYFQEVVIKAIFQCMKNECNLDQYNEYCKKQLNIGLTEASKQLPKTGEGKQKKNKSKQASADVKCNICDTNTKELNSFKCLDCSQHYHKLCVSKRTSTSEFALIKNGDVNFNCDNCIGIRRGITTQTATPFNFVEAIREIVNSCAEMNNVMETPNAIEEIPEVDDQKENSDKNEEIPEEITKSDKQNENVENDDDNSVSDNKKVNNGENLTEVVIIDKDKCERCDSVNSKNDQLEAKIVASAHAASSLLEKVETLSKENQELKSEIKTTKEKETDMLSDPKSREEEEKKKVEKLVKENDELRSDIERRKD